MLRTAIFVLIYTVSVMAQSKMVSISAQENYPPYMSQDMIGHGLYIEIATAVFERTGYSVTTHFYPWTRALYMAKMGQHDLVIGTYALEERAEYLKYSDPIDTLSGQLFGLKSTHFTFEGIPSLEGKSVGVGRGYGYIDKFDINVFIRKVVEKDNVKNLEKLLIGRIDFILENDKTMQYYINRYYPYRKNDVKAFGPILMAQTTHLGISRNISRTDELVIAFNKGLALIKADGTYSKIVSRYRF